MGRTRIGLTRGQADILPLDHVLVQQKEELFMNSWIIIHASPVWVDERAVRV